MEHVGFAGGFVLWVGFAVAAVAVHVWRRL